MFSIGERMPPTITPWPSASGGAGRRSGRARSRRRRGSTGCSAGAATPASTVPRTSPNSRERVERVLRAARVVLAGTGRREQPERPAPAVHAARRRGSGVAGTSRARPSRAPRRSRRRASRRLGPLRARRGRAARRARSRLPGGTCSRQRPPGLAQQPLDPVPRRPRSRPTRGTARPSRGSPSGSSSRGNQWSVRYRVDADVPCR